MKTSSYRIDECLSVKAGRLYIENCDTTQLVKEFGSPLFVVSEQQIRRNVRRFAESFAKHWTCGPVAVLPAAKANWTLAVQRILASEGCGADVYSAGELEIALRAGIPPALISVNGVPKDAEHIARTVSVGARLTIDSMEDVRVLESLDETLSTTAKVRLRLRPAVSQFIRASDFVPEGLLPTDLVALGYKGGLSLDEVVEAGRRIMALRNVQLCGFHQHHGRHHASTQWWKAQMAAFAKEIGRVSQALGGYQPEEIDIGGGFAIPRDPHNHATDYSAPLQYGGLYALSHGLKLLGDKVRYATVSRLVGIMQTRPNDKPAPTIESYAAVVTRTLRTELPRNNIRTEGLMLQLEPGRGIHGNSGIHLATVKSFKQMRRPMPWNVVTLDTSEFWLTAGRFERHMHDYRVASNVDADPVLTADVTGRSCYSDRLLSAVRLPQLSPGDVFAFLDTGAYQEASCSNFNAMPRPASVLVHDQEAFVMRRAETMEDVLGRDVLPRHLHTDKDRPTNKPRPFSLRRQMGQSPPL